MNIFDRRSDRRGFGSSASIKALAQNILNGQTGLLLDCIDFVSNEVTARQDTRTGAFRVIEIVALNRPDLVAPDLHKLLPALSENESRARGMVMRTMGFCAQLNSSVAQEALPHADGYIGHKEGLALASATDLFLGDYGALSRAHARAAFPLLERSMQNLLPHEQDWLLEALYRMFQTLDPVEREICFAFAGRWQDSSCRRTRQRARRILRLRG